MTRQACLNGYTNTVDKIGSQLTNSITMDDASPNKKVSIAKASKFAADVQSPGLKHALSSSNNSNDKETKKQKLSIFQNEKFRAGSNADKYADEERKNEKY